MIELLHLTRAHPVAAALAVVAGIWTVAVHIVDAYHVFEFGTSLPPQVLEGLGLFVFFAATLSMLARFHAKLNVPAPFALKSPPALESSSRTPEQSVPEISLIDPPPDQPKDRIFIQRPPKELINLVVGKMSNEVPRVSAPFIGKWLSLSVFIDDVSVYDESATVWGKGTTWRFQFRKEWIPRLEALMRGDNIRLVGRINSIRNTYLELAECELV